MRYQSNAPKRRFLAGVKCPKCAAIDAVVQVQLFDPEPDEYIECTLCSYSERRPDPEPIVQKNAQIDAQSSITGTSGKVKFIP
ncbi:MAG: YheV family putative metal-binding protein [Psychrobacter sp.]|nr:YheV family putative metal-binding protein [Psychrobacter sp.]